MPTSETYRVAVESAADEAVHRIRAKDTAERLRSLVVSYHAMVWRLLRRFGVSALRVDEAVSQVFDVVVRRLDDISPGKEQAFMMQVCARVASDVRRSDRRRARLEERSAVEAMTESPSPEELLERHQARALLDDVLEAIDPEARVVFVLHEMEQWTAIRIADSLGIPPGTVASRLRRARDQFERAAAQLRRRLGEKERSP